MCALVTGVQTCALPISEDIASKPPTFGYFPFPAVDGTVVPRQLVETFDRGEQAPVPILAGFNSGEIRSLRFLLPKPPADAAAYAMAIRAGYGEFADAFLARSPAKTIEESMLAATPDAMYGWTAPIVKAPRGEGEGN